MVENNSNGTEDKSSTIEEFLREKARLDKIIKERFKRRVTILFTDICDYTQYMDTKGDITGRGMLQIHNDIVLPLIEKHEGIVIKTIGDAVMATFSAPLKAVKASIEIQNGLNEYNRNIEKSDRIYVKIGINMGEALMDKTDVFGDAVNVASRIQSQAEKEQVLISRNVYEQVGGSEDILCRLHGTVLLKGKAEPVELYRVVWKDDDIVVSSEPRVRAGEREAQTEVKPSLKVLHLEITREEDS